MKYAALIISVLILTISCMQDRDAEKPPLVDVWLSRTPDYTGKTVTVRGTINTGSDLGMQQCPEGLYLNDKTGSLQLRMSQNNGKERILRESSDSSYVNKQVEVTGTYPDPNERVLCEALICQCEDYFLAERVTFLSVSPPSNYEECEQAGGKLFFSYPPQCEISGETFTKKIAGEPLPCQEQGYACAEDEVCQGVRLKAIDTSSCCLEPCTNRECTTSNDCSLNFWCTNGKCKEVLPDSRCRSDDDCQLINQEYGFGCCWAGACDPIDFSLDKWTAVNNVWYQEQQGLNCPPFEECSGGPLCDPRPINENYAPKCIQGQCQKVPQERTCKDLCGNGQCEEIVCLALGCPCSETPENCPQDCSENYTPCCYYAPGECLYTGEQLCPTRKYVDCDAPVCNPLVR